MCIRDRSNFSLLFSFLCALPGTFATMGPAWPGTLAPERQVQGVWGAGSPPGNITLDPRLAKKSPKVSLFSELLAYAALFPAAGAFFPLFGTFWIFKVPKNMKESCFGP